MKSLNTVIREMYNKVEESVDLDESTKAYAASLEKMANDRKLKNISKKDRDTLSKLADLMKNANEEVELDEEALNEAIEAIVEEDELLEDYFKVQYFGKDGKPEAGKESNFKDEKSAKRYLARAQKAVKVGEYKLTKEKGKLESVEGLDENVGKKVYEKKVGQSTVKVFKYSKGQMFAFFDSKGYGETNVQIKKLDKKVIDMAVKHFDDNKGLLGSSLDSIYESANYFGHAKNHGITDSLLAAVNKVVTGEAESVEPEVVDQNEIIENGADGKDVCEATYYRVVSKDPSESPNHFKSEKDAINYMKDGGNAPKPEYKMTKVSDKGDMITVIFKSGKKSNKNDLEYTKGDIQYMIDNIKSFRNADNLPRWLRDEVLGNVSDSELVKELKKIQAGKYKTLDLKNGILESLDPVGKEGLCEALVTGVQGKDGKKYSIELQKSGRKIVIRTKNQYGDIDTINLKKAAKLFEQDVLDKLVEDNTNDKSDDGEGLDKVQPKAVKKKFKDRKDKDIDNDGDVDDSDKFLHKKRKAISKAVEKEETEEPEEKEDKKDKKKGAEKVDTKPKLDEEVFKQKYGSRWEVVMEATANKLAMKNTK